ncbi:conserved hypothetical protein [Frankia sp. Hr75.2]|nr:conserved hypothetical protein [Frankia sp. Hr75.2]
MGAVSDADSDRSCHDDPVSLVAVGIRMWCELDSAGPVASLLRRPDGHIDAYSGLSFTVHEFAELSDGREVTLLDDRGWGMSGRGRTPDERLSELTIEEIERTVYMVLLPDWADVDHPLPPDLAAVEDSGGAQDWDLLAERLRAFGVVVTPAELMRVPRRLDLGDRLRARMIG